MKLVPISSGSGEDILSTLNEFYKRVLSVVGNIKNIFKVINVSPLSGWLEMFPVILGSNSY